MHLCVTAVQALRDICSSPGDTATALAAALAFSVLTATPAFAADEARATGEASAAPHATASPTTRSDILQQLPAARAAGTLGASVGEVWRVERPRASVATRAQVRQEAAIARAGRTGIRMASDGWLQIGGEAGTRSIVR